MRWFRFWTHQHRRRQAYFRPSDTSALDAALVDLINAIVTVRFTEVAGPDTRFPGQRLYVILSRGTSVSKCVRPECDFDFLE